MRPGRFEMDFVLNFVICLDDFTCELICRFYLHERIHDPDSVTRIALKG